MKTVSKDKMKQAFKLYKEIKDLMHCYEKYRGSLFGIAVDKDDSALKWQGLRMRLEIVESFLECRPADWSKAPYLTFEQAVERNLKYNN